MLIKKDIKNFKSCKEFEEYLIGLALHQLYLYDFSKLKSDIRFGNFSDKGEKYSNLLLKYFHLQADTNSTVEYNENDINELEHDAISD